MLSEPITGLTSGPKHVLPKLSSNTGYDFAAQLPRRQDTGVKDVEQVAVFELADAVTLTATV